MSSVQRFDDHFTVSSKVDAETGIVFTMHAVVQAGRLFDAFDRVAILPRQVDDRKQVSSDRGLVWFGTGKGLTTAGRDIDQLEAIFFGHDDSEIASGPAGNAVAPGALRRNRDDLAAVVPGER